jgi:hypothetical protein
VSGAGSLPRRRVLMTGVRDRNYPATKVSFYTPEQGTERPHRFFTHWESRGDAGEAPAQDEQYFRQQASRCFEIGRACMDLDAARKIDRLGEEFRNKAVELDGKRRNARIPLRDSDRDVAA